jgi:hypothetical protein
MLTDSVNTTQAELDEYVKNCHPEKESNCLIIFKDFDGNIKGLQCRQSELAPWNYIKRVPVRKEANNV